MDSSNSSSSSSKRKIKMNKLKKKKDKFNFCKEDKVEEVVKENNYINSNCYNNNKRIIKIRIK